MRSLNSVGTHRNIVTRESKGSVFNDLTVVMLTRLIVIVIYF